MAELPPPPEGIVLAHFIVSDDVERSRRFYTEVLGGRVVFSGPGGLTYVALSNTWIIINVGGGPTDDKPAVTLETPRDPDRVSSFLNIRVRDIEAVYHAWGARGARFLTPPKQHAVRDPLLPPRSRRSSDRSGANHGPGRGLVARPLACEPLRPGVGGNAELTSEAGHTGPGAHAPRTGTQRAGVPRAAGCVARSDRACGTSTTRASRRQPRNAPITVPFRWLTSQVSDPRPTRRRRGSSRR